MTPHTFAEEDLQVIRAVDARRNRGERTGLADLEIVLKEQNIRLSAQRLGGLVGKVDGFHWTYDVSAELVRFVTRLAAVKRRRTVLDVWCGYGEIASSIAADQPAAHVRGIAGSADLLSLLRYVDAPVEWAMGGMQISAELLGTDNDLVVGALPAGIDLEVLLLEQASRSLSVDGDALLVALSSRMVGSARDAWLLRLQEHGLRLAACFWLPRKSLGPTLGAQSVLVHIARGEQRDVFVAELPETEEQVTAVLNAYQKHRQTSDPRTGRWIPLDKYTALPRLVAREQLERLGRALGPIHRLADVATVASWAPGAFSPEGAVLIPRSGSPNRPVVLGASADDLKGQHLALRVRDDVALPEFVAHYFNSSVGRLTRETLSGGVTVPHISAKELLDAPVFFPPLKTQVETLAADGKIASLQAELAELRHRIWQKPKDVAAVASEIAKVNHEDRLDTWLETLPFPLATILWLYHTQTSAKDRVDTLLHFFEAYAQYWATVLLSIDLHAEGTRQERQVRIHEVLKRLNQDIRFAGIGTWNVIIELLAKDARALQGQPDAWAAWRRGAALGDTSAADMLHSKVALEVLKAAGTRRNTWKGHGGVVSDSEASDRLVTAEGLLWTLRTAVGEAWATYPLYRMGGLVFEDGLFLATAERAMGSRAPFRLQSIELRAAAEKGRLYLAGDGTRDALPLMPFVKLMPAPKTEANACYFYNRATKDGVRFVSYHFAVEADITGVFDDTARALDFLTGET